MDDGFFFHDLVWSYQITPSGVITNRKAAITQNAALQTIIDYLWVDIEPSRMNTEYQPEKLIKRKRKQIQ